MATKKVAEVEKALRKAGFTLKRQTGSHRIWAKDDGRSVTVAGKPNKDIPIGTLKNILKQAGITL